MKKVLFGGNRANTLHMTKGRLKMDGNNKMLMPVNGYKGSELFSIEFDINETPPSARTLLTKGFIQDEINSFSGATVSTRGRFMTEQEKSRCPHERPLYLFIQGHSKHNIDMAVQKINEIIKTEHRSSLNRPSRFTNAPPPLMSLHSGMASVEKICIGIENPPQGFDLRGRILGVGGANLLYIRNETGSNATLRGRGSQFIDQNLGAESPEPLHLFIENPNPVALQNAKQLAINLIQTMQSELQTYIQQQPPPIQSQQIIQQPVQQIQQAQFQTMNIGALGQPNVVTIQHQDIIQHPQSNVVTIPATILTATVASTPGSVPLQTAGLHAPVTSDQTQEIQAFVPPSSVSQVQLIGPPPGVSQVQYQIHPSQPLHIQGIPPPGSQASTQPMTQMYVMSQPPPQQNFSSNNTMNGTVSYVYTQPNIQRSNTPSQNIIETVNVNLQQPPPSGPINVNQQPPPPPSLLHLHFPPPFPPNQPPPPISQTYQIQYQQLQTSTAPQAQTQFVIQHGEHPTPQTIQQTHEPPPQAMGQHIPQFENQPPPQLQIHGPPPSAQNFMVQSNAQQPVLPPNEEVHQQEDHAIPPQPVPPPQIVPPPSMNQIQHSMNIITSVPPPNHPPPQAAPWLYQGQPLSQPMQNQLQVQIPPNNVPLHAVPPPDIQSQMQYHAQQIPYQNGQMQTQLHYSVQPQQQMNFEQTSENSEYQKGQSMKRRYSDLDGTNEQMMNQSCRPPTQRHGTGDGEQQQQIMYGPPGIGSGLLGNEHNKLQMPPPYQDERRAIEHHFSGQITGCEQIANGDQEQNIGPPPNQQIPNTSQASWQPHYVRFSPNRPPPKPRDGQPNIHSPSKLLPPHLRAARGKFSKMKKKKETKDKPATVDHLVKIQCQSIQ